MSLFMKVMTSTRLSHDQKQYIHISFIIMRINCLRVKK